MKFLVIQTLNGLSFGMLLFLMSAGLSLIFGLMRVLNLAQCSYYLLGAYIGFTVIKITHNFLIAILGAIVVVAIVSLIMQRYFLNRFYKNERGQVLLTFGFLFIISDLVLWIWGGAPQTRSRRGFSPLKRRIFLALSSKVFFLSAPECSSLSASPLSEIIYISRRGLLKK